MASLNDNSPIRLWLAGWTMALLAIMAGVADQTGSLISLRASLHDVLSPGRLVVLSLRSPKSIPIETAATFSPDDVIRLNSTLQDSERQRRQLIIETARLRDELRKQSRSAEIRNSLSPDGIPQSSPLVSFTPIPVRVVSSRGLPDRLRELMIDAGKQTGLTQSELVVDGDGLILDGGTDHGVAAGDRALSGSVVVGRIAKTGRWISLVQPVTDKDFTARAQLLRRSADGLFYGAEGMLSGTGEPECRLTGVSATEAVSVGDEVVTAEINGVEGPRLYFGRVSFAEFLEGGQWLIRVQPALAMQPLDAVNVVRMELNAPAETQSPAGRSSDRTNARRVR